MQSSIALQDVQGLPFRLALNDALQTLITQNSGPNEPSPTYAFQPWADTTTGILKQRNAANNDWVEILDLATGRPVGAVAQTSPTGALLLAEGTDTERPVPEDIPAGVAAVRGNSTSLTDYFLELWNRRTGVWDALASRTWVTAAINALNKITGTGAAPYYGARAWVNFNGTGTVAIRASGNVSSITDHGTGDYTVNFTIPLQDANFSPMGSISNGTFSAAVVQGIGVDNTDKTPSSWRFRTGYANPPGSNWLTVDYPAVHVAIFR